MEGVVNPAFWAGRRVLVTGHTGFKGGWLALWLARLGARVHGFALPPEAGHSLFADARVDAHCCSSFADVRDAEAVRRQVSEAAPEVVFHLAAQPLVRLSYATPAETWATNVTGTVNVLEACRGEDAVRAVVVVTSDKCYEHTGALRPFREGDALGGHDPYSSSKAAAEIAVASWRASYFAARGVGLATARAGNVIGGGDWAADRLIPDLVRASLAGSSVPLRRPHAVRPWQHVLDAVHGYLLLAQALHDDPARFGEAWNFGPDDTAGVEVIDIARRFTAAFGERARFHVEDDSPLHEAAHLTLDSGKARRALGWSPRLAVDDAVALTAAAYRRMLDGDDAAAVVERQIEHHQQLRMAATA